ncbi:LysR family transcriptional regulator [Leucobacter sp. CSA2]|uniref:LysR family transcriptional regulator n=2 Tax=Leucobacter edaphi TaxID=2796472 RepID=A0A934UWS0_9MICO|nr:LysR substrate-binding domain-containing protein [Leucobacter edaphi]MBK0420558.1 LysR family transcriptional regulator [Leucobacter edaphi]
MIERAAPGAFPAGTRGDDRRRHALRLYTEALALVVPADHELAELESLTTAELTGHLADGDVTLLDHPDHSAEWPAAEPWADPSWKPRDPAAALQLVAAGTGAILLPLPLARHLVAKREHAVLALHGEPELAQSTIWATWALDRDAADVQQLVGIMRGRTARSSRPGADTDAGTAPGQGTRKPKAGAGKPQPSSKKSGPKPGSRGAQLAASKKKPKHISRPKPKTQQKPRRRK